MNESVVVAQPKNTSNSHHRTAFQPAQEVRFAVVLFGGVSLAVYINGVVQELLHLVRASAPHPENPQFAFLEEGGDFPLKGSEKIYRELAARMPLEASDGKTIRTRFVIDIVSGTSAGGINGIFLAKALARNLNLNELAALWEKDADLDTLLNDKKSYVGTQLRTTEPSSLLNSRRMTWKLLEAFEKTEKSRPACGGSLVDELDLNVTTTDLHGQLVLLRAGDKKIFERHHKQSLGFHYSKPHLDKGKTPNNENSGDFSPENNALLTFAARATSSFPLAFEPATLREIDDVAKAFYKKPIKVKGKTDTFTSYLESLKATGIENPDETLRDIPFGDGGFLDNKPFSAVFKIIKRRRCELHVERRLIYVEPSPEHPEDSRFSFTKPDALESLYLALVDLPRRETIREDLEKVEDYNNLVYRAEIARTGSEEDISRSGHGRESKRIPFSDWRTQDLFEMIEKLGPGYGSYHRLKVSGICDAIAEYLTTCWRWPRDSEPHHGIRHLLNAWRQKHYSIYKKINPYQASQSTQTEAGSNKTELTENAFISEFDLYFGIRRLRFVAEQVVITFSNESETRRFLNHLPDINLPPDFTFTPVQTEEMHKASSRLAESIRSALYKIFPEERALHHIQGKPFNTQPSTHLINQIQSIANLDGIPRSAESQLCLAASILTNSDWGPLLDQALEKLKEAMGLVAEKVRHIGFTLLPEAAEPIHVTNELLNKPNMLVSTVASYLYRYFEQYDMIIYPILYGQGGHEGAKIEILRISPEDATSIYDQRDRGRTKLAGDSLAHFAAFLDEDWRRNDRIWGRLDATERILDAIVAEPDERRRWQRRAQEAILEEEFGDKARAAIDRFSSDMRKKERHQNAPGLMKSVSERIKETWWSAVLCHDPSLRWFHKISQKERDQLATGLLAQVEPQALGELFADHTASRAELPAERQLELAGRSAVVLSDVLGSLPASTPNSILSRISAFVRLVGSSMSAVLALSLGQKPWDFAFRGIIRIFMGLATILTVILALLNEGTLAGLAFGVAVLLFIVLSLSTAISGSLKGGVTGWLWKRLLVATVVALIFAAGYWFGAQ